MKPAYVQWNSSFNDYKCKHDNWADWSICTYRECTQESCAWIGPRSIRDLIFDISTSTRALCASRSHQTKRDRYARQMAFDVGRAVMDDFTIPQHDRRSRHKASRSPQNNASGPSANLRHLLVIPRVMDGRGVVPTLSSSDVETAAQVLQSISPSLARH